MSKIASPFAYALAVAISTLALATSSTATAQVLAGGGFHNCATTVAGGVVCWGGNSNGQLGDNSTTVRPQPVNVIGLPFGSTAIAASHGTTSHTCAVVNASAKCWGANDRGQMGDNSTTQRLTPVNVTGLGSGMSKISAGDGFSCALSTTGGIQCWGRNNNGQLGDGTAPPNGSAPNQLVPVTVAGFGAMAGAIALTGSYDHACAVNSAGGAVCWGQNFGGRLGDGSGANFQNAPVNVTGLGSGVAAMATGSNHSCALTTSGAVKCWGDNGFGIIGNGTTGLIEPAPLDVTGLGSGVTAISAGQFHTCALITGGSVKCWGANSLGQIGDGTTTQRLTPVQVIASGVIAVSAGATHTCALFSTGVSSCWGANINGQIGIGAIGGPSYVPVSTIYPTATTTMLASNLNPSVFGDNVTFTATVSGGVNGTLVAFQLAGVNIAGCGAQALAAGVATCTTGVLSAGMQSVAAIYQGNAATLASTSAGLSQVVNPAAQTITFDALADKTFTVDPPFMVSASASSGLGVTFASTTTAVCTVSGVTVTLVAVGTCNITADQSGNANFIAAPQVARSFNVISPGPSLALLSVKSRKTHTGVGDFDIAINPTTVLTGLIDVDPRVIGTGHRIVFSFNVPITPVGAVSVTDTSMMVIGSASLTFSGNDVIVLLTGIPDIKRVLITLNNINGSGPFTASVGFFVGDVSNNRFVNTSDILLLKGKSGPVTTVNFRYDVNASGFVNTSDILLTKGRSGPLP